MKVFRQLLLIAGIFVLSNAAVHNKKLKPGEEFRMNHKSDDGTVENTWNLEAEEGCKFVLSCHLFSRSCDNHLLTIFDGNTTQKYCGPGFSSTVLKNSVYNKMSITIMTKGKNEGSMCHVASTIPYTNIEYIEQDSSEHGLGKGATRQTTCKCGWSNKSPGRIVGGKEATPNEYPFVAYLKIKHDMEPLCGASIITRFHALTAAHCTFPFKGIPFTVAVGVHDIRTATPFTQEIDVKETIEHPKYVDTEIIYDIAALILDKMVEFNEAVGPACLPNGRTNLFGQYIKVLGWGRMVNKGASSPILRKVNLRTTNLEVCRAMFTHVSMKDPYQICTFAPDRDSCQGDSGGPLVWQDPSTGRLTQVALVSYGRKCGSTDPAVNTDISYFMDWIKQVIADTNPQEVCV
uniref:Venom S1 protease 41 n=1 Tax=Ectomocoris sp. TaxID=3104572 RepID=A0AB38ZEE0_9HEMI